jgi:hypothetical protein
MAQIKLEAIIERLDPEMRRALEGAVKEVIPGAMFDSHALFRAFKRHINIACST